MAISAMDVKKLREMTGAGMLDCKKALEATDGDFEAAVDDLRKKGIAKAAKRSGRVAADGTVAIMVNDDTSVAAMTEVNCETDFVARGNDFNGFVASVLNHVMANPVSEMEELLGQTFEGAAGTIQEEVTNMVAKTGENMGIRRFIRWERSVPGIIKDYIHMGGKIGVLAEIACGKQETAAKPEFDALALDVCLQIAAMNPLAVSEKDLDANVVEREMNIYKEQAAATGKPEKVVEGIALGKLNKWYKDVVLYKQEFFKDAEQHRTIEKYLEDAGKELGDSITVLRYARFQLGEGIEKKEGDLAAEVAEMIK